MNGQTPNSYESGYTSGFWASVSGGESPGELIPQQVALTIDQRSQRPPLSLIIRTDPNSCAD